MVVGTAGTGAAAAMNKNVGEPTKIQREPGERRQTFANIKILLVLKVNAPSELSVENLFQGALPLVDASQLRL